MKRLSPLEDGRAAISVWKAAPTQGHVPWRYELKAKARSGVGKGAARALRREGWIPAVIYGDKKDPLPISISYNEAMKSIYAGGFLSHVITVDVDGTKHRVIPRDYQLDPVKDTALHVDFLRVGANTKLNVQVAVHFVNQEESPGIKKGGVLNIVHHTVELSCPANAIPDALMVDLTGREVGDTIHISSLQLPAGTTVRSHEEDLTIATIVAPSGLRAEEARRCAAAGSRSAGRRCRRSAKGCRSGQEVSILLQGVARRAIPILPDTGRRAMHLIVGLGNPGDKYRHNRHNIGFLAVDAIASRHAFPPFREKFNGLISEGTIAGEKVLILKPQTFMNSSGESVEAAAQFYKLTPADITVIYDELDLVARQGAHQARRRQWRP